jgi:hypothetical protein
MIERNVFWVEFSLKEFVSLMIIFVKMKHPAAIEISTFVNGESTSYACDCATGQHHSPCLCTCAQGTADEEDEYCGLHYKVSTKDISNLSIDG